MSVVGKVVPKVCYSPYANNVNDTLFCLQVNYKLTNHLWRICMLRRILCP